MPSGEPEYRVEFDDRTDPIDMYPTEDSENTDPSLAECHAFCEGFTAVLVDPNGPRTLHIIETRDGQDKLITTYTVTSEAL